MYWDCARARSLVFVAEMRAHDTCFQIFKRAQVFDNIAAGIVEEQLAVLGAPDRDNPFELIAILEQIVDGLSDAAARDNRDLWARRLFLFLLGHRFADPLPAGEKAWPTIPLRNGAPL